MIETGLSNTFRAPAKASGLGIDHERGIASDPPRFGGADVPIQTLISQMQAGDRLASAHFVTRFGALIRRRYRHKLGRKSARLFDSQDLLSTVARRLDVFVLKRQFKAGTEPQLWALLGVIAEHAVADKLRSLAKLERAENDATIERRVSGSDPSTLYLNESVSDAIRKLSDETDRQLLMLWMLGVNHRIIAEQLGLTEGAVRVRWHRLRATLRGALTEEATHGGGTRDA